MKRWHVSAVFLLLLALSMAGGAAAQDELSYYGIETVIDRTFTVHTTTTLIFEGPVSHLDYNLDFPIFNLTVDTPMASNSCDSENEGSGSVISCDFYGMGAGDNEVQLSFYTRNAIKKFGANYEFRASYPISTPTKRMYSIIRLPPKGTLAGEIANQSFFPPDGKVLTDGKNIIISWEKRNLTATDTLTFSTLFEVVGTGGLIWDISVIALTLVVVVAMIAVAVYMRRSSAPAVQKEVKVLPLLNKEEKKIVDILARQGGEARQRALVKETDFSKAKVSRLIRNLKERGVIDVEPISGRENKVILKIKGIEVLQAPEKEQGQKPDGQGA